MKPTSFRLNTICTHTGNLEDKQFKGATAPLYMSTSYAFEEVDVKRYPRYFNTPNQTALAEKLAALEHTERALIFGSGMAAISTAMLAYLRSGDHVVIQQIVYGGTYNLVVEEFEKLGIEYSFTEGWKKEDFEKKIRPNTRVIFLETPSNPLLTITDLEDISALAKEHSVLTMIDNTFASPVNQNPIDFGIDLVIHSATKYLGGHSDILAGVVCGSEKNMEPVYALAKNLGGSLSDYTVWLLERSIKTLGLRVKAQNRNAKKIARHLNKHKDIKRVYYPGLKSHPEYEIAKKQMKGFGGMMSFELNDGLDPERFRKELKLIRSVMSLAGVESTMVSPSKTSHALLTQEDRDIQGINDRLIRFSVGIEDKKDLIEDIEQALKKVRSMAAHVL